MNTIVQSSNCPIVKSICYFTISRFSMLERTFPPPSRGRLGGDCITNISSILYVTIPSCPPLTKGRNYPCMGGEPTCVPYEVRPLQF